MITLHAFGRVHPLVHGLTRDLRVEWALEELGLPYRVHGLDHTGGETGRDEFRRISPFMQLPVIGLMDMENKTDDATRERRAGLLAKYPKCEAYRQKCEARPAWGRVVAAYEARLSAEPGAVERAAEPR